MKKLAYVVPASLLAALLATSACTVSVTNGPIDGSVFFDDGGPDSSSVVTPDSGTPDVTATPDTGTDGGVSPTDATTTDGAPVCTVPAGSGACDTCVLQSCCAENQACATGPMDDAGNTECENIASCFNDCRMPPADSGIAPDTIANCITTCSGGHTTADTTAFQALETCQQTNCGTQCQ
jgi:hypothetical protein